jgi:acetyl-CoA carboxylase carboxyltransferase component
VQVPNGVIDMLVRDEADAVATAKRYLGYFTGTDRGFAAPDQRLLRALCRRTASAFTTCAR